MKRAPLYNTIASLLFTTWICAQTPSKPSEIEIIFDDSAPSVTQSPETIAPPSTPEKSLSHSKHASQRFRYGNGSERRLLLRGQS